MDSQSSSRAIGTPALSSPPTSVRPHPHDPLLQIECTDAAGLPVFAVCYVGWKVSKKTKLIPLAQIDFTSGMRELDAMQAEDEEKYRPDTPWKKFIAILF